ncbi:MAG: hypothetical protein ABFS17_09745 [Chloroflexota bacterium]
MSFETPFINAAMARLNQVDRMIAAFGIVYAISLIIESPVISLLPTSTALTKSKQNYCTIRRFTIHLMLITTALHFLIAWTPLFDLVIIRWMKTPEELIELVRLGLKIMVFWSASIAYRRFRQGILIRNGLTKFISQGTILRLIGSAGTALGLATLSDLPGIAVGSFALTTGVIFESFFIHLVSRKEIKKLSPNVEGHLSYLELVKFQTPLALSNIIYLAASPLITTALARGPNPIEDLAVWPVLNSMLFVMRAPAVALPEAIIALYQGPEKEKPLRQFSQLVGAGLSGFLLIVSTTSLAVVYFTDLIGISPALTRVAIPAAQAGILLPILTALMYYYRGILTAQKLTVPITLGMVVELLVMAVVLFGGVYLGYSGVLVAVIALTAGITADALLLILFPKFSQASPTNNVQNPN